MLTTIPTYDVCATLAAEMVASIQKAFPALEARYTNDVTPGPLVIEARNPLNGDCWAALGTVGPTPRNAANIEVLIGSSVAPAAKFTGNAKAPPDSTGACRTMLEYVTKERARQAKQIAAQQALNASLDAAKRLRLQLKKAGLPLEGNTPHLLVKAHRETGYGYRDVPEDCVAIILELQHCVVTPEVAAEVIKHWKRIGKLLADAPSIRTPATSCPSAGTLVN
jgi:hypothetical protein